MKKVPIFLLLAILFSACYKSDPPPREFHITGRVLAYGTNEPVAGARVWVTECTGVQNLTDPCIIRTVASDTTDEQGLYEVFPKGLGLEIGASKVNYDSRNASTPVNNTSAEKVIDIVIRPDAWLDISIKNTSGALRLDFEASYPTTIILPKDSTSRVFAEIGGNANKVIKMGIYAADGKYTRRNDTVYCPGLDTIFHRIEY